MIFKRNACVQNSITLKAAGPILFIISSLLSVVHLPLRCGRPAAVWSAAFSSCDQQPPFITADLAHTTDGFHFPVSCLHAACGTTHRTRTDYRRLPLSNLHRSPSSAHTTACRRPACSTPAASAIIDPIDPTIPHLAPPTQLAASSFFSISTTSFHLTTTDISPGNHTCPTTQPCCTGIASATAVASRYTPAHTDNAAASAPSAAMAENQSDATQERHRSCAPTRRHRHRRPHHRHHRHHTQRHTAHRTNTTKTNQWDQRPANPTMLRPPHTFRPPPNFSAKPQYQRIQVLLNHQANQLTPGNAPHHAYIAKLLVDSGLNYTNMCNFQQFTHTDWNDQSQQWETTNNHPPSSHTHILGGHASQRGNIIHMLRQLYCVAPAFLLRGSRQPINIPLITPRQPESYTSGGSTKTGQLRSSI